MSKVRLRKSDLPQLIENIENHGGDASALRAILEEKGPVSGEKLSDEDFISEKLKEAVIEKGQATCPLCENPVDELISGVCRQCFRAWALTAKKE